MKARILFLAFIAAVITSCTNNKTADSTADSLTTDTIAGPLAVDPVTDSKEFPDAGLTITSISSEKISNDSAKLTVNYAISNFKLTEQTADANADHCNNSQQGQHIHFILDDKPYTALYEPKHSVNVALGTEHYLLSFLSRSYHESVKNATASVLSRFRIDADGKYVKLENAGTPMVFYSRPKGEYKGKDTQNVLLDFFLWNTKLSPDGNQLKVSVNDSTFTLTSWQPHFIKNAPKGDLKVRLELVDKDGKPINGVHTSADRTVKLVD